MGHGACLVVETSEEEGDWSLTVLDGALATVQGDGIGEAEIYRLKRRPGPG